MKTKIIKEKSKRKLREFIKEKIPCEGESVLVNLALDLWNKESKRCKLWTLRRGVVLEILKLFLFEFNR